MKLSTQQSVHRDTKHAIFAIFSLLHVEPKLCSPGCRSLEGLGFPQTSLPRKRQPLASKHLSFLHVYICSPALTYMTKKWEEYTVKYANSNIITVILSLGLK